MTLQPWPYWAAAACLVFLMPEFAPAQQAGTPPGALSYVDAVTRPFGGVMSATVSPDGKLLYLAGFKGFLTAFKCNSETGALENTHYGMASNLHLLGANSVRASADGRWIITTALYAGAVTLFERDAESGRLTLSDFAREQDPTVPAWRPSDAVFAPHGKFAYVTDERHNAVYVFEITAGRKLRRIQVSDSGGAGLAGASAVDVHPGGKQLYAAGTRGESLVVFDRDVDSGKLRVAKVIGDDQTSMHALSGVTDVVVSGDGNFVYTNSGRFRGNYAVAVFQRDKEGNLKLIQEFFDNQDSLRDFQVGNQMALAPGGLSLYVCAKLSGTVVCLQRHPDTGLLSFIAPAEDQAAGRLRWPSGLAISPDGKFVYATSELDDDIVVFRRAPATAPPFAESLLKTDAPPGEIARLTGHTGLVKTVSFSADGRRAISGSWDGTVRLWDLDQGIEVGRLGASLGQVLSADGPTEGRLVAGCGSDGTIRIWDVVSKEEVRRLDQHKSSVSKVRFSADGARLLSVGRDRQVRLWDSKSGDLLRTFDQPMEVVNVLAFSPNGREALCAGGFYGNTNTPQTELLRVWDLNTGEVILRTNARSRTSVSAAAFSPDGKWVVASDVDNHGLGAWDLETGQQVRIIKDIPNIQAVSIHPSGRYVACALYGGFALCDLELEQMGEKITGHEGSIDALAISPDGRFALTGGTDKTIRLWRLPELAQ